MNQKQPKYVPTQHEVTKDTSSQQFVGKYIVFNITGTWMVKIDNLIYLPGDIVHRELQGEVGELLYQPVISFKEDMTTDPAVQANKRLIPGQRILVEFLKLQ
jgi:hypothetical protein